MRDLPISGQRHSTGGWLLGLEWILSGTLGWPLGFVASILVVEATVTSRWVGAGMAGILTYGLWDFVRGLVAYAAFGAALGVTQWFVLREKLQQAVWWIFASATGMALGWLLEEAVDVSMAHIVGVPLGGVRGWASWGVVLGIMQWLMLRTRVRRAGWWILASVAGLILAGVTVQAVSSIVSLYYTRRPCCVTPIDEAIGIALLVVFGTMREATIGLVLVRLLRHPTTPKPE